MNELVQVDRLNSDQEDFAAAIIASHGENLPDTIQEIIPILAFSKAKMEAFNALSDAARKVQDQESLNKAALESGQRWGIVHLYGQKRLGEITREIPKDTTNSVATAARLGEVDYFFESKKDVLDKSGIKKWESTDAERIAAHPEIMEKVIEDAKERGDIPTKGAVLSRIKAEKEKERAEEYKREVLEKKEIVATSPIEIQKYLSDLRMALHYIPADIPADGWNETTFAEAKSFAEIIIARLEKFNGQK